VTHTVASQWESFAALVLPADAGDVQRQETRRAFYAGAQALLGLMMHGLEATDEVTDDDVASLTRLQEELAAFVRDVKEGRA
jgi:hypothetical protein